VNAEGKATFAWCRPRTSWRHRHVLARAGRRAVDDGDSGRAFADGGVCRFGYLRDSRRHLRRAAVGPSTGMPTRTSQRTCCQRISIHGDTKHIVLLPGSVKECFELGYAASTWPNGADPVFVLTDLDWA